MKVYMNGYKDNWISPFTILEKIIFWRDIDYDEPAIERWANRLVPLCEAIRWLGDRFNRQIRYVKVDHYDVWSMDSTLAHIIVPMLRELQRVKHGAPHVDITDVPEHLWPTKAQVKKFKTTGQTDPNFFKRWDYVLSEMIWAHEQFLLDDPDGRFYDHTLAKDPKDNLNTQVGKIKVDRKGLKAYHDRWNNGLRLFGKYYRSLWD